MTVTRRTTSSLTPRDSRALRSDTDGRTLPGCVATPPADIDRYRGYDHRRCGHPTDHKTGRHRPGDGHPTPLATGYRRCAGDPACEIRIPTRARATLCSWHQELYHSAPHTAPHRLDELMGANTNRGRVVA